MEQGESDDSNKPKRGGRAARVVAFSATTALVVGLFGMAAQLSILSARGSYAATAAALNDSRTRDLLVAEVNQALAEADEANDIDDEERQLIANDVVGSDEFVDLLAEGLRAQLDGAASGSLTVVQLDPVLLSELANTSADARDLRIEVDELFVALPADDAPGLALVARVASFAWLSVLLGVVGIVVAFIIGSRRSVADRVAKGMFTQGAVTCALLGVLPALLSNRLSSDRWFVLYTTFAAHQSRLLIPTGLVLALVGLGVHLWLTFTEPMDPIDVATDPSLLAALDEAAFDASVMRGFDDCESDRAVFDRLTEIGHSVTGELAGELIMFDESGRAGRRLPISATPHHPCGVDRAAACPAAAIGDTTTFVSGRLPDACPKLAARMDGALSAVCAPVVGGGRVAAVIHVVGPEGAPPSESAARRLALSGREAGRAIGRITQLEAVKREASTDGLTDLMNRRAFERDAGELVRAGGSIVFADVDHFKRLNDEHGHDVGDQALRLFADVLKSIVRGNDLVARFGGEEFVMFFPGLPAAGAAAAADRARATLATKVVQGIPTFTASFGVADSRSGADLESLIKAADAALYESKRNGRDRVTIHAGSRPAAAADATPPTPLLATPQPTPPVATPMAGPPRRRLSLPRQTPPNA